MPAAGQGFDNLGIIRRQISLHDIGPAQEQAAAFRNAVDRVEPPFHARDHLTDRARPIAVRVVDGHDRRRLGRAVAFQQFEAVETGVEQVMGFGSDPFCSGDHEFEGVEIIG